MSHQIEINADGTANAAFARVPAWHRLGTVMDRKMTVSEAVRAANLGNMDPNGPGRWNVRAIPAFAEETVMDKDGVDTVRIADPRNSLAVRTNPVTGVAESLGVVGNGFGFVQNEELGPFMEAILDKSGAEFIDTAGSLDEGRRVFMTAKLPQDIMVGGVDRLNLYLAILNAHDGTRAFTSLLTPIRVVCANTEGAALRNCPQSWTRRHSSKIGSAVAEAAQALGMAERYTALFAEEAERMIQTAMTEAQFQEIVAGLFPAPEEDAGVRTHNNHAQKIETITGLWHADTQKEIAFTRWAGYNALTEFSDHYTRVQAGKDATDAMVAAVRARNAVSPAYLSDKSRYFQAMRVPAAAHA